MTGATSMLFPIVLCRRVVLLSEDQNDEYRNKGWYCRAVELPVSPHKGLGICIDLGLDPFDISDVYVNYAGAVICHFDDKDWIHDPAEDDVDSNFETMCKFLTGGWFPLKHPAEKLDLSWDEAKRRTEAAESEKPRTQ